ncbi:hypothetical protein [Halosegnis sp.]|uniref:hypothetical protein n=1 Tax=Halosegnis sp. TaxID=2864959 RepID=UPI0035D3EA38
MPTDRHDAVLTILPAPLLAGLAWAWLTSVGTAVALGAGSLFAVAPLAYALFVRPP